MEMCANVRHIDKGWYDYCIRDPRLTRQLGEGRNCGIEPCSWHSILRNPTVNCLNVPTMGRTFTGPFTEVVGLRS